MALHLVNVRNLPDPISALLSPINAAAERGSSVVCVTRSTGHGLTVLVCIRN